MQINLTITADGKTNDVKAGYADIIALEEHFDIDASVLATRQRASWLAFLAWHALKRTGETDKPFDAWKETIENLQPEGASGNA